MSNLLHTGWRLPTAAVGLLLAGSLSAQPAPRPPAPPAARGADQAVELARGPIHEAFGQPTVFNPEPGPVVAKKPPELINEVPPEQKPEGDNLGWIPGYWAWDDEAKSFLWVSGFWRAIPPGRLWVPGYWATLDGGYQWASGYWVSDRATEIVYLPPPPETLESGPVAMAEENQVWVPGIWVWRETRYWWRPGFWTTAHPDWVWVPDSYVWSPSGFIFVDGYWDYPMFNRGLLFAAVTFTETPRDAYTPSVVIDSRFLPGALFVRPTYMHYYFGDYYDAAYSRAGIYAWFAFHNSRFGYDPLFAQTNYVYTRRDPQWATRVRETFVTRRGSLDARPPHTVRQFHDWARRIDPDGRQSVAFVKPLADVLRERDFPVRLERLDETRLATVRRQAETVQQYRNDRIRLEQEVARDLPRAPAAGADPKAPRAGRTAPARVKMPEPPRLHQTPTGVGGKTAPPKGTVTGTTGRAVGPPEPPRMPELTPPNAATQTDPKGVRRPLPHPDDNFTSRVPGRLGDPAPMPLPKGTVPGTTPPAKDPLPTVPPKANPPGTDPPKDPPGTLPRSDPGATPKGPINPRSPSITPDRPPGKDPPATPPKKKDG